MIANKGCDIKKDGSKVLIRSLDAESQDVISKKLNSVMIKL